MFIDPRTAIKEGWVTGIVDEEKQVQPNAIDFTADKAWRVDCNNFFISEGGKIMRGSTSYEPEDLVFAHNEIVTGWLVNRDSMLDVMSDMYVKLPDGVAAQLVIRSSLARNGIVLQCGLYDSGFEGHIGCILHNLHNWNAVIAQGTRVGQIIFIEAKSAGLYDGQYKHEEGTELEYQE